MYIVRIRYTRDPKLNPVFESMVFTLELLITEPFLIQPYFNAI